ncbi:MAG TPA: TIGR02594 family protein [Bradyrhizobium sp.]|uniref:TIGR02594 family protein n=1 Tax=Bradyrhizobium sp. TaxID=376 RepID=UPI002BCF7821|nr:TIGR02594 family protein [Bradyrhizobium sp.]HLZ05248.1 TIGR02594 family protein [Bradyrhizobium sp.]
MVVSSTFRRPLVALALLSAAVAASASPASARSRHGVHRAVRAHAHYAYRHVRRHFVERQVRGYRSQVASYSEVETDPQVAHRPRLERHVALRRLRRFAHTQASVTSYEPGSGMATSGSLSSLVMEAREFLGTKPNGMGSLWCARFMNMVLEKTGHRGTGSAMASSFAHYGQRVSGPEVGAIAVMSRRGGGHVGIITGIDASGNPIMISGNNGNRVREAPVSRGRIYAYVMPN